MGGTRASFSFALTLLLLSSGSCAIASADSWDEAEIGHGITVLYPANWHIANGKPLTIFSPGKRLEGVGIGPGTAEVTVLEQHATFDQFVDDARADAGILSIKNLLPGGVRGCPRLRRVIALENDGPPEAKATILQVGFFCERRSQSLLLLLRCWRNDPKHRYFQKIAERMARGIRF
ncbi:MAG: hypothetical protein WBQ17_15185 [Rhizomicrobium sp.]